MKLICDFAEPAARVLADVGEILQVNIDHFLATDMQLVRQLRGPPLVCPLCHADPSQLPLHPGSLWRHPVEVSGKRRNQRGAAAVFVLSGSAFS